MSENSNPNTPHRQSMAAAASQAGPFKDLRSWLSHLENNNRLQILKPGAKLAFEIAGIANRWDGKRATVFPRPGNADGTVVSGLLSQRTWMAEALGVSDADLLQRFQAAVETPLPWNEVTEPACQQVVHDEPDLTHLLPIPTHNEHDSGAYITAGLVIVCNPATGRQNVAIHRLQVSGPRHLGALLLPRHTLAFQQMAEAEGADLDVAIVIGSSPAALLSSQAIAPLDQDELEIAGALVGAPIDVAKCIGSEVRVPASSEIVIEGRFLANAREPEGPFGEFPQYYAERAKRHVVEVDRVTTRRKPIYHTIVGGSREHLLLGGSRARRRSFRSCAATFRACAMSTSRRAASAAIISTSPSRSVSRVKART